MLRIKILIVDDEKSVTDTARGYLEDKYEVMTENNGLKALETAREFEPHLIILDILFPDTSGGEIASQIQNNHKLKDTPIVFLTGILKKEEEREIAGHPFLSKPVSKKELYECIENYLKSDFEGQ